MSSRSIAIIILNWNGKEDTVECLESLHKISYPNYRVILVDNASTDGSAELFRQRYPDVELIVNEENLGFAGGNNVGIRHALDRGYDYVLLLNNDTEVEPDFLGGMVDAVEAPHVGIVGPKICFFKDKSTVWAIGGRINLYTGNIMNLGWMKDGSEFSGIRQVDYVTGCALLIKREVIEKIGLLDPDYFLYFEDTAWNMKAHKCGYQSIINCDVRIYHKYDASDRRIKDIYYYYICRNLLIFAQRNTRWYHKAVFYPTFFVHYALVFVYNWLSGDREKSVYIYRGIRDFLAGRYGAYRAVPGKG